MIHEQLSIATICSDVPRWIDYPYVPQLLQYLATSQVDLPLQFFVVFQESTGQRYLNDIADAVVTMLDAQIHIIIFSRSKIPVASLDLAVAVMRRRWLPVDIAAQFCPANFWMYTYRDVFIEWLGRADQVDADVVPYMIEIGHDLTKGSYFVSPVKCSINMTEDEIVEFLRPGQELHPINRVVNLEDGDRLKSLINLLSAADLIDNYLPRLVMKGVVAPPYAMRRYLARYGDPCDKRPVWILFMDEKQARNYVDWDNPQASPFHSTLCSHEFYRREFHARRGQEATPLTWSELKRHDEVNYHRFVNAETPDMVEVAYKQLGWRALDVSSFSLPETYRFHDVNSLYYDNVLYHMFAYLFQLIRRGQVIPVEGTLLHGIASLPLELIEHVLLQLCGRVIRPDNAARMRRLARTIWFD